MQTSPPQRSLSLYKIAPRYLSLSVPLSDLFFFMALLLSQPVVTYLFIILLFASSSVKASTLCYILMHPQNLTHSLAHGRRSINVYWWRKEWVNEYLGERRRNTYLVFVSALLGSYFNRARTFQFSVSVVGVGPPRKNFQGVLVKTCQNGVPGNIPLPSDLPTTLAVPFFFLP